MSRFTPPPDLKVSEWADRYRKLSPESSAVQGQWRTSDAEYQRGIMDAILEDDVTHVVVMKSSQVGWTEILNNIVGYFIHQDPCPILVIQPTLDMGKVWSQERLEPLARDTPVIRALMAKKKQKILRKSFPGGNLSIVGPNSPSGLASRPIRLLISDETDRYASSAGDEGDPVTIAEKRTTTFQEDARILLGSSPGNKTSSRVEHTFNQSDQRRFFVPCPDCAGMQYLKWHQIKWPPGRRRLAYYECEHCGFEIPEEKKDWMVRNGKWVATAPFDGIVGFHIWEAYSPWSTWAKIAIAQKRAQGKPDMQKVWVNTCLGETWEDEAESVDGHAIFKRREAYNAQVPKGVLFLTAGVDVQPDRLEVVINGWGKGMEKWTIDHRIIYGSPEKKYVWQQLDYLWTETFQHETGAKMFIDAGCIDSGYATKFVYDYCRNKRQRRVFCIKGKSAPGLPAISAPSKKLSGLNRRPVPLYTLGVDELKAVIYGCLRMTDQGPGYHHFPMHLPEEYFKQLTSEVMKDKFIRGYRSKVWEKVYRNNEVLDCEAYSLAAVMLVNPALDQMEIKYQETGQVRPKQEQKQRSYRNAGIA